MMGIELIKRKIGPLINAFVLITLLLVPATSFSSGAVKFRHIVSIYSDDKGVGLKNPEGVACSDGDYLIVADSGNGRLLRFTFKDKALKTGNLEIKAPQLPYPMKVKINSKSDIYVLDGKERRIVRVTPEGGFMDYVDPEGLPSPASYVPRSFDIDKNDNIYVLDIFSRRVLVLDPEGKYLRHIGFPKEFGFISDLAVDFKDNALLIDSVNAMVFSAAKGAAGFSPLTKSLKQYVRFPTSITIDNRGRIYLVDRNGGNVVVLGQDGSFLGRQLAMGWKKGFLNHPSQLCINGRGEASIADTNNHRIQIYQAFE